MSRLLDETLGYGSYQSRCDAIVPSLWLSMETDS